MSLDTLVQVTITTQTATVTRAGYGTPLVLAYHTNWPERVRSYNAATALTDMVTDGFATTDSAYLQVQAVMSQNPRPPTVKVGRLAETPVAQSVKCTPTAVNEAVYTVTIDGTAFEYTSDATATVAEITAGLETIINAGSVAVTATDQTTYLDLDADVAGTYHAIVLACDAGTRQWERNDETTDPGYATDLAAIVLEDNDWYGLSIEAQDAAAITSVAAWAETNRKLFCPTSGDTDILDSGSTDIASTENALSHAYTAIFYSDAPSQYAGAAAMGALFPFDPGSETWAYKTLSGVSVVSISSTEFSNATGKYCNLYTSISGRGVTYPGQTASGEFIDITRFVDWLRTNIQADVYTALVNSRKVPYTAGGIAVIEAAIKGVLLLGIARGGLAADPEPIVETPDVADVSTSDKAARILRDVTFGATLAGAIHTLIITGSVSA